MSERNDRRLPGTGALLAVTVVIGLLLASGIVFWWKTPARPPSEAAPAPAATGILTEEPAAVMLVLPSEGGLVETAAQVERRPDARSRAYAVVASLLSDERADRGPVLANVGLRELYLDPAGTAYLDLASRQKEGIRSSAWEELLAVQALVNTVMQNVEEIKQVRILIDGKPAQTLSGHIDLTRSYAKRTDLVKR